MLHGKLFHQLSPAIDDIEHVLQVVTGKEVAVASRSEGFELGREECCRCHQADGQAIAQGHHLGRPYSMGVPAVGETKHAFIHRHQVEEDARRFVYLAADDAAAHLARKALRFHTRLDAAESGPIKIDHRIDVIGGAYVFSQWIRHQQANDCPAKDDYVFAKLA